MTFRRSRHGTTARFSDGEAAVLSQLLVQLLDLLDDEADDAGEDADPLVALTGMTDAPTEPPSDPVLARLLPDAYRDDPEHAAEFRRFTESELRDGKRAAARVALESIPAEGGRVVLDEATADAWLGALNDLRLALGTRLDVTEGSYDDLESLQSADADDPRVVSLSLYVWLGYLQESLVDAVS